MKLLVDKKALVETLNAVTRVKVKSVSDATLECVEIEAKNEEISFKATNLELEIKLTLPANVMSQEAQIEQEGKILVSAKRLHAIAKKLPAGKILLEANDGNLNIQAGKTKMELLLVPGTHPNFGEFKPTVDMMLKASDLQKVLKVGYAAYTKDDRPILQAIKLSVSKDGLIAVATDSHRLSIRKVESVETAQDEVILTPSAASLIDGLSLLPSESEVHLLANDKFLCFRTDYHQVSVRQIDGKYPDISRAVPTTEGSCVVTVKREELADSLERALIVAESDVQVIDLHYHAQDELQLYAQGQDIGKMNESVPVVSGTGEISIRFNGKFLLQALQSSESERISIRFHNPLSPFVIDDTTSTEVILPIRMN